MAATPCTCLVGPTSLLVLRVAFTRSLEAREKSALMELKESGFIDRCSFARLASRYYPWSIKAHEAVREHAHQHVRCAHTAAVGQRSLMQTHKNFQSLFEREKERKHPFLLTPVTYRKAKTPG